MINLNPYSPHPQTHNLYNYLLFFILIILTASCGSDNSSKTYKLNRPADEIIERELADVATLNPMIYTTAESGYIVLTMFYPLIAIDFKTLQFVPVLVKSLPEFSQNEKGELLYTYEIRPEAVWDNGQPITARDVEFTLKVLKNPKVDCDNKRAAIENIHDVILYNDNPRKYTIVYSHKYMNAMEASGDLPVIPQYLFDAGGIMNEFSIRELTYNADKLAENPKIIEYGELMNSERFQKDKDILKGSGPYELDEWVSGQKIVLKRKQNWWGNALKGENCFFEAYPSKITHQIINDKASALTALKGQNIDIMRGINPNDFVDLQSNEKFLENFNLYTPQMLAWSYIGINTKLPKLSDKKVRQALAHLADVDRMIEVSVYGFAQRTSGPIRPDDTKFYNKNIKPYNYNLNTARQLLTEAGWKDSNGDGIVDKVINGQHTELKITLDYNTGNDMRKNICLLYQEEARKAGIEIEVRGIESVILRESLQKHEYEMAYGAWSSGISMPDLKQLFHTESSNGGSNYESFGNAEADALLDSIRVQVDEDKIRPLYMKLQEIIHDECAHIFLFVPKERIAIHKRFTNAYSTTARPGYWIPGLMCEESTQ